MTTLTGLLVSRNRETLPFTHIFAPEKSCFAEGNIIQSMKVPLSKYVSGLQKGNEMYRNAFLPF